MNMPLESGSCTPDVEITQSFATEGLTSLFHSETGPSRSNLRFQKESIRREYFSGNEYMSYSSSTILQFIEAINFAEFSPAFDVDGLIRTPRQSYSARIDVLRRHAREDGYDINSKSEADFWHFFSSAPNFRRGSLVLVDNGNLRAMWRDKLGNQLGLQFLGDGMLQYVVFALRPAAKAVSRVTGRDTFEGIMKQVNSFNLDSLLCE